MLVWLFNIEEEVIRIWKLFDGYTKVSGLHKRPSTHEAKSLRVLFPNHFLNLSAFDSSRQTGPIISRGCLQLRLFQLLFHFAQTGSQLFLLGFHFFDRIVQRFPNKSRRNEPNWLIN